tara:strand:- start:12696 stop:21623 length:8928 start_codon:yes stop_codon:yes gene_type:complete
MTKALLNKIVLLAFMLAMMGMASGQSISYSSIYDISGGLTHATSYSVTTEQPSLTSARFSPDGHTLYTIGNSDDEINQYSVSTAFDLTSTVVHQGLLSVSVEISLPYDFAFSSDGKKLFVVDGLSVYEYSVSSAFDVTSTVTFVESISFISNLRSIRFSNDGETMFLGLLNGIRQYSLTAPYDISTFSYVGTNEIMTIPNDYRFSFNSDGSKLFTASNTGVIKEYKLVTPFDVTAGATGLSKSTTTENSLGSLFFSQDGTSLFLTNGFDEVSQYNMNAPKFKENGANNGAFDDSFESFSLEGETFVNAGANLTLGVHYQITNLPTGLSPVFEVSADGTSAHLSFTGNSTSHENADDVSSLIFNFLDGAFTGGDASAISNAQSASSGIAIDFRNSQIPIVGYSEPNISIENLQPTTFSVAAQETAPTGMTFNGDGTKMFIVGTLNDQIIEYSLTEPYEVLSGASATGNTYSVSGQDTAPQGIQFNDDGTKVYILGGTGDDINQYSLSIPYDITSTVVHQGTFSISTETAAPEAFVFSPSGEALFLISTSNGMFMYLLDNPFDITSGVNYESTAAINGRGIQFSSGGRKVYIETGNGFAEYELTVPFNISFGTSLLGSFSHSGQETQATDFFITPDNTSILVLGNTGDDITQFDLFPSVLTESFADDGSFEGSFELNIVEDFFANAGGSMTQGVHYSISNLPSGLSSTMNVSASGTTAELMITGNATSNDISDKVANLVFTFNDAAFVNSVAADVTNAVGFDSRFGLNFIEMNGIISAPGGFGLSNFSYSGKTFGFSAQEGNGNGLTFSNDGTQMFIAGNDGDDVGYYILSTAFDVSTAAYVGALDISGQTTLPSEVTFNNDGTKMYVSGGGTTIYQYSLTTPFDLSVGVTSDGSKTIPSAGMAFSPDGSRLITLQGANLHQYALETPFDIMGLVIKMGSVAHGLSVSSGLEISSDGTMLFAIRQATDQIYPIQLTAPYDILGGITGGTPIQVTSQETLPFNLAFSPDGSRMFVTGASDEVNQYDLSVSDLAESGTNDGSVSGSFTFNISGEKFANAGGTLTLSDDFTITNLPTGLVPVISVDGDGRGGSLSFSGNADSHQNADDVSSFTINFLNSAFGSNDASSVINASYLVNAGINFTDNGTITYEGGFSESYLNDGSVLGSVVMTIVSETFSKVGLLTSGVDYNITGIPSGLTPQLSVAGNRLSATLTLTGIATDHQDVNDVSDLVITFENSAFTSSDAEFVFNAVDASIGSGIDFNDNIPTLRYGNRFDLSAYPNYIPDVTFDLSLTEDSPGGMAFSNDGFKMFIIGYTNKTVYEFNLTSAFDISDVTYSGNSYTTTINSPSDLVFDSNGTTMFIMDGGLDQIQQYGLSSAFDLTSTITPEGTFSVSSQDIQAAAMTFSPNGKKMYMLGSNNDKVFQYSLTNPYDITTGVTYDEVSVSVNAVNYTDIQISDDGKEFLILNSAFPGASYIRQYELATPYDISGGISVTGGFYYHDIEYGPTDIALSPDNKRLIVLGAHQAMIYQFDLPVDGFIEVASNDGSVEGSLHIEIKDDQFTHSGESFEYGTDYTINNLPAGLSANLDVNGDGYSATVTLSGVATAHQDIHDVVLEFTFNNSAFVNSNAADVVNAISATSSRKVDFRDNNPFLTYGNELDMDFATNSGSPLDVSVWGDSPTGVKFSDDGLKIFISIYGLGTVYQYNLTDPYEITSGVTYTGSYDHSAEDSYAEDLDFSADGLKMFILGSDNYTIFQYNLTNPFDITSGVTYSGNSFLHEDYTTSLYGFTFKNDGTKLYLADADDYTVKQFSLSTAYDLSTITYDGDPFPLVDVSPTGIEFSTDGRFFIMTDDNTYQTVRYKLYEPWDVTKGGVIQETYDLDALSVWGNGIGLSPDGSRVFIVDGDNYEILQFEIDLGDFKETIANDGTLDGVTSIYLIDDTFTHANDVLGYGTDYTVNNLPAGLTPTLTVSGDGYSAVLTLTGSAASHGDVDDISSLQFSFNNSAFTDHDAIDVENAVSYDTPFGIDFSPYTDNDIVTFTFSEINGEATIDASLHTVTAVAEAGTDVSQITPMITISPNATVSPDTGVEQDFTSAVTYTVTAEDGTEQAWEVTVTEALATPTDILLSSTSIDENGAQFDLVGDFTSIDASFNDTHVHSLVSGEGDDDNTSFVINEVTQSLVANEVFDFETKNEYHVRIQTNDGNGGLFEKPFVISINDVNEIPTDITLDNSSIDESNPTGTVVGSLATMDEDIGQSYTYSLVAGTGDTDNASFSISGSELVSAVVFDFETQNAYSVRVQTNDGLGGTFEKAFAISINDLPAQVTSITLSNSAIDENEVSGTLVGTFETFGEDLSGSYTYTFVTGTGDDNNGSFTISGNQLLTAESLNFEAKSSYSVLVMSDDGVQSGTKAFTIAVNDISEAPTDLALSNNTITENNVAGEVIGLFTTTDEDAGESFTYSLAAGSGDTDNASFLVVGGELLANAVFDFEAKATYSVRVATNDGNGGTFEKVFMINIGDENESILVTDPIADFSLDEGFGTHDIDLSTVFTDQDGDELTFEVISNNTDVVNVSNSLSILTIMEVGGFGSATIMITADDGSGVTNSHDFMVTVVDVNEAPVVANAIGNQMQQEGFGSLQVSYAGVFTDGDGDVLTIGVLSSETGVVTATIIEGELIEFTEVGLGTSTITLTADDERGGVVETEFSFTVTEIPNTPPVVANEMADDAADEGFGTIQISYEDVFTDADGDELTISVLSSETTVVTAAVIEGTLIEITEVGLGSSVITLTADDNRGGVVSTDFIFTVTEVPNNAPVVANAIPDDTQEEGFRAVQISYADVFTDADGDVLSITVESSKTGVVTASIIEGDLIEITEVGVGSSIITVTAKDANGGSVSDEFTFTVTGAPLGLGNEIELAIYPNPTSDYLNVESDRIMQVRLADLNGHILKTGEGRAVKMELGSFADGVYLIIIEQEGQSIRKRIIKAN